MIMTWLSRTTSIRLVGLVALAGALLMAGGPARAGGLSPISPGGTTTQQAVDQINRSVTRPLPTPPPAPVYRPDNVWVPERWGLGDVRIPGHYERRLPDGSVYVPPVVVTDPRMGERLVPGHVETSPVPPQLP
jgi:hypothetical protein